MKVALLVLALALWCGSSVFADDIYVPYGVEEAKTVFCYGYLSAQSDSSRMNESFARDMRKDANKLYKFYRKTMDSEKDKTFRSLLESEYSKGKDSLGNNMSLAEHYIIREYCKLHAQKILNEEKH
ncbi:MAG: hypothetical protein ABSA06_04255 [Geobacteraceae bacterium]|jgi:hypothetical protein